MRAFTENWANVLLKHLNKDKRAVFCCATSAITKENPSASSCIKGYGVTINLNNLCYSWNQIDDSKNETETRIPCIMGASYASNISYWKKLRGLKGLRSYGYDEQFISLKVALEGGECKIIKEIVFGHIFRKAEEVPYLIDDADVLYNILYIIELLYPQEMKTMLFFNAKCYSEDSCFNRAVEEIRKCRNEISEYKKYYESIFTRDFSHVIALNNAQ